MIIALKLFSYYYYHYDTLLLFRRTCQTESTHKHNQKQTEAQQKPTSRWQTDTFTVACNQLCFHVPPLEALASARAFCFSSSHAHKRTHSTIEPLQACWGFPTCLGSSLLCCHLPVRLVDKKIGTHSYRNIWTYLVYYSFFYFPLFLIYCFPFQICPCERYCSRLSSDFSV